MRDLTAREREAAKAIEAVIHRGYGPLNLPNEDELFDEAARAGLASSGEPLREALSDAGIERAAKAVWESKFSTPSWDDLPEEVRAEMREQEDAALRAALRSHDQGAK